jgi:hypothetical protein
MKKLKFFFFTYSIIYNLLSSTNPRPWDYTTAYVVVLKITRHLGYYGHIVWMQIFAIWLILELY